MHPEALPNSGVSCSSRTVRMGERLDSAAPRMRSPPADSLEPGEPFWADPAPQGGARGSRLFSRIADDALALFQLSLSSRTMAQRH